MKRYLKAALYVAAALVLLFIGWGIGVSKSTATIKGEKVTRDGLAKDIGDLKSKKSELKSELSALKDDYDAAEELVSQKDDLKTQLDTLNKQIDVAQADLKNAKSELKSTQSKVDDKKKDLASLTGQVQKAKSAPKTLAAGRYEVGKDIPEGRYKATPVGEGSNFVTFDGEGVPDVNTILGVNGEASYTFMVYDGYTVQTEATVKLTPID